MFAGVERVTRSDRSSERRQPAACSPPDLWDAL